MQAIGCRKAVRHFAAELQWINFPCQRFNSTAPAKVGELARLILAEYHGADRTEIVAQCVLAVRAARSIAKDRRAADRLSCECAFVRNQQPLRAL